MVTTTNFIVNVNSPTVAITVTVADVGTVNVTVMNNATPPIPIMGATVAIGAVSAVTDVTGLAILNNIPYGTQSGTVTTP